ncbi:MAG TPA: ribosomal protein S18-alanine N-acetyltransferase [Gemmatimonadales bacterium]|jgi:ribosomal-protein-alanine N-acetyltransferase
MPAPELRPLTDADLDRVTAIERDTFADPWTRKSFAQMIGQRHVRAIAACETMLVGYALGTIAADEGEVLNIAVAKASQGKGVGRLLLEALLEELRQGDAGSAYLEVRRSNQAAIGLYRAVGFRPLGVRPAYYASPREDALTMALELGSQTAKKG